MRHRPSLPALILCLAAAAAVPAQAQAVDGLQKMMTTLHKSITAVVTQGAKEKSVYFTFQVPGTSLGADLDPTSDSGHDALFGLTDAIYVSSPLMVRNGEKVSDLYKTIIMNHQTIKDLGTLTADEKQKQESLAERTSDNGDLMMAFMEAAKEVENDMSTNALSSVRQIHNSKLSNAKKSLSDALETLSEYASRSGGAWWQEIAKPFNDDSTTIDNTYLPPPADWMSDNGWVKLDTSHATTNASNEATNTAIAAGVSGRVGWFKITADMSKTDMSMNQHLAKAGTTVSFELKRVDVFRKWFNPLIFLNANWTLPSSVFNGQMSDGLFAAARKTGAQPPFQSYVTSLILVRNVDIHTKMSAADISAFKHTLSVNAKIGIGPFSIHASYSKSHAGGASSTTVDETGIHIHDPQIIGALLVLPPRFPLGTGPKPNKS